MGILLKKTPPDPPSGDKVFSPFELTDCTKISACFPILGTDFCAKSGTNKQLGIANAHRQCMLLMW
jgi:hypothetical protein